MTTFSSSQSQFNQYHFTVVEIDLPVVEGACTISGNPGYGTPLSCDEASNATRTYKFVTSNAPILPESEIYRVIKSVSETPTQLKSGKGLSSRGTADITLIDFTGDPNKDAPAVDSTVVNQGTFFGKLDARQILTNKPCRIKNYRVESNGTVDLETGAEIRYYIVDSFVSGKSGSWKLRLKDELSVVNIGDSVWPIPQEGFLRTSTTSSAVALNVDANVIYSVGDTVRIGEEFCKIINVNAIGTGSAQIEVQTRGTNIVYTNTLTRTIAESHDAGDEIFLCEVSDDERLDDLLERILLDIGIEASYIPKADWTVEVDTWHAATRVNTLWFESQDINTVLTDILTNFMLDMWFDPVDREIKLKAISAWQESALTLTEGNEINYDSITRKAEDSLRSTRAYIVYDKPFLATSDDIENYTKASLFKRTELESDDLFGKPKTKRFDMTSLLVKDSADLLVNRWVNRYSNPFSYSWTTPERKRNFNIGDIVEIKSSATTDFSGVSTGSIRAQINSIKPMYSDLGREYRVSALAYDPVFASGSEIVISGSITDVNLYIQYAGAPSSPVTITFIFDGALSGSSANSIPSIRAGSFPVGSKIILILVNGADLQAKGGDGGRGGGATYDSELDDYIYFPATGNGSNGGIVYDAEGIDTDIYFSGATPSVTYATADGYIRAPSGGDAGFDPNISTPIGGDSGNGGAGRSPGVPRLPGTLTDALGVQYTGDYGTTGTTLGPFGLAGANNNGVGGSAGSGVIDNGATVVFYGDTPTRYINGNGDH